MKNIHVILVLVTVFICSVSAFGQKEDSVRRAWEMREEFHRRLRDHLFHGFGSNDDLFKDMEGLFDDMMLDSFDGFGSRLSNSSSAYQTEWQESKDGRILVITPKDKNQKLDINIEKGFVTIKGMSETKSAHGSSMSSFSNSFNVPGDVDWTKVTMDQKDEKILVRFPWKDLKEVRTSEEENDGRRPLPPSESDITI